MPRVFISYRRKDAAAAAGRVYDRLSRVLAGSNLFFDVNTIGGGEDFKKRIASQIEKSDTAIVFIGDSWLGESEEGERIRHPDDHVRAEVRAALARDILIVPVLVGDARMPIPEQLPEDIRGITDRNALPLRHESFDVDTERIVATVLRKPLKQRTSLGRGGSWSKIAYALGGMLCASVLILVASILHSWVLMRPLAASIGVPLTVLAVVFGLGAGAWVGLTCQARKHRAIDR